MENPNSQSAPHLGRPLLVLVALLILGWTINIIGPYYAYYYKIPFLINSGIFPDIGYMLIGLGAVWFLVTAFKVHLAPISVRSAISPLREELQNALRRLEEEPNKAKPAWDLARVRLELYFDRNLSQINYIFWLSVGVMVVGFTFILFGISSALMPSPDNTKSIGPAVVGGIAGVVTEFIGATFLFIFRSTMQQASTYTQTLERINSVGMAMQILDTISDESRELQNKTKAEIVMLLLSPNRISKTLAVREDASQQRRNDTKGKANKPLNPDSRADENRKQRGSRRSPT